MSWSFRFEATPADFDMAGIEAMDEAIERGVIPADQARQGHDAMAKALDVAIGLVRSGVVGPENKLYSCSVSGHANPDHLPAQGWANDAVSISISQMGEPQ